MEFKGWMLWVPVIVFVIYLIWDYLIQYILALTTYALVVFVYGTMISLWVAFDDKWKERFGWKDFKQISDWIWLVILLGLIYIALLFYLYLPDLFYNLLLMLGFTESLLF